MENQLTILEYIEKSKVCEFKIIFVLDDSSYGALKNLQELVLKCGREDILILQYEGRNPGGARNRAIRYVTTPWVQFCDSDDSADLSLIIDLLDGAQDWECDAIVAGFEADNVHQSSVFSKLSEKISSLSLEIICNPGIWRWIFRSKSIERLQFPETRMGEDQVFLAKFLATNPCLKDLNTLMIYKYRSKSPGSLTSQYNSSEMKKSLEEFGKVPLIQAKGRNRFLIIALYLKMSLTIILREEKQSSLENIGNLFKFMLKATRLLSLGQCGKLESLGERSA